ncbi:MAG: acyl-CoA dehydrogenase [Xanthomonadales bacterium]|nr:acyl-CoA dehydrogenase [Xanthomonadales bacterium]
MNSTIPFLVLLLGTVLVAHLRLGLRAWTLLGALGLAAATVFAGAHPIALGIAWGVFALVAIPFNLGPLRRAIFSGPFLKLYQRITPQLSETEKTALEAGTVGWEGELFSGRPDWRKLAAQPKPALTAEEQAFLDGPVDEVCKLHDEWEATHVRADLSPQVWEFLKKNRFFGMIIPKSYGGLGFSALAHSAVVAKCASVSGTLSSTVCVPNSLGPGELLLHYGTDEQKSHYLPRLARGEDIPCFALTNPHAGSDATSIPDFGIVCKAQFNGEETLGIKLTFDKRYITLAPIATIVGLAFRLHDPDGLLGGEKDRGITLALIPRNTAGLEIGRRHMPLNVPFQNGPVRGKDVFIPMHYLIGGEKMIGQGWRMLVECLSVGRAISLPSTAAGGCRMGVAATGAYARIRKQFQMPIGRFEGVEEALARIGGLTYAMTALSRMTAAAVDMGEKPSVPSAIAKYHATETGAIVVKDAMDIHGGKGIILGPRNYLGRAYQAAPISITVEGANILTRSMIIFGQGAVRCHPFVLKEMQAAQLADPGKRLAEFDRNLMGHIGFAISNGVRSLLLGLTHSHLAKAPLGDATTAKFYKKITRYSANLALVADTAMATLGGKLKVKEKLSARLGDVLSQLYIMSSMLKRWEDQGRPIADYPLLAWAMHDAVYKMQIALDGVLRNFPIRPVAWLLRALVFPLGLREHAPSDRLGHRVCTLLLAPSEARNRLVEGVYLTPNANNVPGRMHHALDKVIASEPVERKVIKAVKAGQIVALEAAAQLEEAVQKNVITGAERDLLAEVRVLTNEFIAVDDFDHAELEAASAAKKTALKAAA